MHATRHTSRLCGLLACLWLAWGAAAQTLVLLAPDRVAGGGLTESSAAAPRPPADLRGWGAALRLGVGVPEPTRALDGVVEGEALVGTLAAERLGVVFGPVLYRAGLGGAYVHRRGRLGQRQFRARTLRVTGHALLGARLPHRVAVYGGVNVRNRKAFADFDARTHGNLRFDALLLPTFALTPRARLELALSSSLSYEDDGDFIVDPRRQVTLGLGYTL